MSTKAENRTGSRWRRAVLVAVFSPLIICAGIVFLPLFLVYLVAEGISYRLFCWRNQDRRFLVCTTRHGWKDFIDNNLVPVLPEEVGVIWYASLPLKLRRQFRHLYASNLSKPYLAFVARHKVYRLSLNDSLQPLKRSAGRDSAVRQKVWQVVVRKLSEIRLQTTEPADR